VLGWLERLGRYAKGALHPSAHITPEIVVHRVDDRLFFAYAGSLNARLAEGTDGASRPGAIATRVAPEICR